MSGWNNWKQAEKGKQERRLEQEKEQAKMQELLRFWEEEERKKREEQQRRQEWVETRQMELEETKEKYQKYYH